jgi:NTP pyrophosphatase (non-canonical NTP hydrolase)
MDQKKMMDCAARLVKEERERQIAKWGMQEDNTMFAWMSVLMEEAGELAEAVNETEFHNATHPERGGIENIRKEAVHVAAVAMSIIEQCIRIGAEG